jgi:hypothetical protein
MFTYTIMGGMFTMMYICVRQHHRNDTENMGFRFSETADVIAETNTFCHKKHLVVDGPESDTLPGLWAQ